MGFFTWRATKKTKREVQGLRHDMARQRKVDAAQTRLDRLNEAAAALPQEGKDEINALRAAYHSRKPGQFKTVGMHLREQEAVIRKYTRPKGYEEVK